MEPKVTRNESERQSAHFRNLQWAILIINAFLVISGLAAVFYAQIILKTPESDLTQFYYIIATLITSLVAVIGWAYGTSIGSSKNAESMRKIIDASKSVDDKQ